MGRTTKGKVDGCIRVSRVAGREGDSYISPTEQRKTITNYAGANGLTIAKWHLDEDVSGGTLDRPGLQDALGRCRSGETGGIIVAKLDRLTRSVAGLGQLMDDAKAGGWNLIAVDIGLDLNKEDAVRVVAQFLSVVAEWERTQRKEGWDTAQASAVSRGIHIASRVPTGYRRRKDKNDKRLEVDPRAAKAIRELFHRRSQGAGWTELARFLDTKKVSGPYDNKGWTPSAIAKLIHNRVYLGEARSGRHVNADAHEPLVTPAEWETAQSRGQHSSPRSAEGALLSGLVRCAGCRYLVKPDTMKERNGSHARTYRCRGRHAAGSCQASATIMGRILEPWVEQQFLTALGPDGPLAEASEDTAAIDEALRAVQQAEHELASYNRNTRIQETLTPDLFADGLDARKSEVDDARTVLASVRDSSALADAIAETTPGRLVDAWPTLTVREKRALLTAAIDCVVLRSVRGSGSAVTVDDRARIFWRGTAPTDLPRRGHRVPLAPWDESPANPRMAVSQDREKSLANGRTRSRGKRQAATPTTTDASKRRRSRSSAT